MTFWLLALVVVLLCLVLMLWLWLSDAAQEVEMWKNRHAAQAATIQQQQVTLRRLGHYDTALCTIAGRTAQTVPVDPLLAFDSERLR